MIAGPANAVAPAAILVASIAGAPPSPVVPLAGPIRGLAACDAGIVAITGAGAVRVLDPVGRPLRTLWSEPIASEQRARWPAWSSAPAPAIGPTADSGWTLPYDPDNLDHQDDPRLADEAPAPGQTRPDARTRSIPAADLSRRPVVVAGGDHAWIGRADGLWRVELANGAASRSLRSRGDGIRAVATSADGRTVAAVDAGELLRSRDGGNTFDVVAPLPTSPRVLVTTPAGTLFLVGNHDLRMVHPDHSDVETLGFTGVIDVASCGANPVVLANGRLYTISDPPVRPVAPTSSVPAPIGTTRINCHATGSPWIARGSGVWTSTDRGQSWIRRLDLPPVPIIDAAVTTLTLWVATASGLLALPSSPPIRLRSPPPTTGSMYAHIVEAPASPRRLGSAAPPTPRARWWHAGLPRIDLFLTTTQTSTRRELCAWIVATFSLDRPRLGWPRPGAAREAALRRIATEQAGSVPLATPAGPTPDPITLEEQLALKRIREEDP